MNSVLKFSVSLLLASGALIQSASPQPVTSGDLNTDILITTTSATAPATGEPLVVYWMKNTYTKPLVAGSYTNECGTVHGGGSFDAALANAFSLAPNRAFVFATESVGCIPKITSVVFADGRQDGEPEALALIKKRREWALAKLEPFIAIVWRDTMNGGKLDVDKLVTIAENSLNAVDKMTGENVDRTAAESLLLQTLLDETKNLQAQKKKQNPRYPEIEAIYRGRLDYWRLALKSTFYPTGVPGYTLTMLAGEPGQ